MKIKFTNYLFSQGKRLLQFTMRTFIFLLCSTAFGFTSSNIFSQNTKVHIDKNQFVSIDEVFDLLRDQTDYTFIYQEDLFNDLPKVELKKGTIRANKLLETCFYGKDFKLKLEDNKIIIIATTFLNTSQQKFTVSGKVSDTDGQPLPGASIVEKGTSNGVTTDFDGNYSLENVAGEGTIVFSYLGMTTQEIEVGNRSTINVTMVTDAIGLDEVVAIGYGSMRKSDLTGSVASVTSEEMLAYPTGDAIKSMQGRAAGVQIQASDGEPGSQSIIQIRGSSSINAGSDPVFVIDGFVGGILPAPEDIESIEILKDASATAIYGSRGANGVVLVTTKKGIPGQTKVEFRSSVSLQKDINRLDLVNSELRHEVLNEAGLEREAFFNPDGSLVDIDWQDEIFQTGMLQNYQLSVAGGSEKMNYYISGVYHENQGIVKLSDYDKFSVQANIDVNSTEWLRFGTNINFSQSNQNGTTNDGNNVGVISEMYEMNPNLPVYNEDGTFFRLPGASSDNPLAMLHGFRRETTTDKKQINIYGELDLVKELKWRSTFGVSTSNNRSGSSLSQDLVRGENIGGEARINTSTFRSTLAENYLTFNKNFDISRLTLIGGYSYQKDESERVFAGGAGFITDLGFWNLGNSTAVYTPTSSLIETELSSFYGRGHFSIVDRYLITATARYDGASAFSKNHKWAFFPSAALAWNVKNEGFMQEADFLSQMKIRTSYGITGNQAIRPYSTLARFRSQPAVVNQTVVSGLLPDEVANDDLTWESTKQLDIGLDLGLWNNRLSFVFDYYNKTTEDLIFSVQLPQYSGYTTQLKNIGSVRNSGVELSITSRNTVGEFKWKTNFNISRNKNQVLSLPNDEDITYEQAGAGGILFISGNRLLKVGESVGVFNGFIYDGVYQEGDTFIPGAGFDQEVGGEKWRDINGRDEEGNLTGQPDGQLNSDDRTIIGNPHPDFIFGMTNEFNWKGFDLNVFFQGSYGGDVYANEYQYKNFGTATGLAERVRNRWTPTNTNTDVPKLATNRSGRMGDNWLFDGSYLRLKNITLGYTFSPDVVKRLRCQNLRLFIGAQNIFTITNYPWVDPEVNWNTDSSEDRNTGLGTDFGSYPSSKSITLGINITI